MQQTYRNFELILVDDGSTDGSAEISDKLTKQFFNIKVIHNNHSGIVEARKTGIFAANGAYIVYVDADDYIQPFALQTLFNVIDKNFESDIVVYAFEHKINNNLYKHHIKYEFVGPKINDGLYDKDKLINCIYPWFYQFRNFYTTPWRSCYKTSLLKKHFCRNSSLIWREDTCFIWENFFMHI